MMCDLTKNFKICNFTFQKRATVPPLSDALLYSRTQIINYTSLVIQGLFTK